LKNYCKGLLLPGERKSIEPMAGRLDPENIQPMRQSLHHMVAKAPWSDEVLLEQVRQYVLPAMQKQGPVVAWIVDDTGFPKKGKHSVGCSSGPGGPPSAQCFCVHRVTAIPCSSSSKVRAGLRAPRLSPGPLYMPRSVSLVALARRGVISQNNSTSKCSFVTQ